MLDPNLALQQILQTASSLPQTLFPPTSRYHGTAIAKRETADGRQVAYLQRRFLPPPERFATLHEHTVTQGERLDNLAAHYLGDAEQFWRLCDANRAMHPLELERLGYRLRLTLPEGVPGLKHV